MWARAWSRIISSKSSLAGARSGSWATAAPDTHATPWSLPPAPRRDGSASLRKPSLKVMACPPARPAMDFFFRGKPVVVIGGGNTAIEEALYLSHIASKVTLVHRRKLFRAERILQERLFKRPNVELILDHVVDKTRGPDKPPSVSHVRLRNVKTESLREVETDGVFVAIGHEPASGLFKGQLAIKPNGYIETAPFSTATSVPGVFAAGDVADDIYRQAVTAAGLGCVAAIEAERRLAQQSDMRAVAE